MNDDVQYDYLTVKAIKGTERRTIEKKQSEGWEFVSQEQGNLVQSTLKFRKVKKPTDWKLVGLSAGAVAALAIVGMIVSALGGDDKEPEAARPAPTKTSTSASPEPTESATAGSEPSESETTESSVATATEEEPVLPAIITIENNKEFAALQDVTDTCAPEITAFSEKYAGQIVSFDGVVSAIAPEGDATTRFRLLLTMGTDVTSGAGPALQYRDVNTSYDMNWTQTPDKDVEVGDTFRFTAEVGEHEVDMNCLFLLDPVETAPLN